MGHFHEEMKGKGKNRAEAFSDAWENYVFECDSDTVWPDLAITYRHTITVLRRAGCRRKGELWR